MVGFGLFEVSKGWPGMYIDVQFVAMANDIQVAGAAVAVVKVEERIRRGVNDSGWVGGSPEFYWDTTVTVDHKVVNADANMAWWDSFNTGDIFDDFFQQNRMIIKDCFGNEQTFYFQERRFQKMKVDAAHWQLWEA